VRIQQSVARCLVIAIIVLCEPALAQRASATFGDFVALLENGERVEGTSCILKAGELWGVTSNGVQISEPLSSVKSLYVATGSKTGHFALLGGACGLGVGLAVILSVESHGNGKVNYSNLGGVVVAGAVIGAVLGAGQQSWEMVDLDVYRRSSKRDSTEARLF